MRRRRTSCCGLFAAMAALAAAGAAAPAAAEDAKQPDKSKDPPKVLSVDLGKAVKLELILIPAGEFMMGSPESDNYARKDEKHQHRVRITKPFYLGKFPVTQEQWEAVMGKNPSVIKSPTNPVENVSSSDCEEFLKKLNAKMEGANFRLPTEAQWEYACRAGSKTRFCFGDDEAKLDEYAWYWLTARGRPRPVGGKRPNAWGLYDMQGNVSQWCDDWYDAKYYAKSPVDDPPGAVPQQGVVFAHSVRGGFCDSNASECRSASRNYGMGGIHDYSTGLRVARVVEEK